ncbi:MgtC/SapB family protein [Photobacterium sp. 1_MG-2023]|uniref:MgtC/SapB family protein n=1 Tax=Photobacterium sp. 1_MG-2023 TaxID=3062646 RepID=UPI0026E1AEE1|nr:MgtC/SapB family protein [Photobacterium sp. 1_MG-2023]MDO6706592.1 MgtC/SapB family protein [Photobacterium sp. 1_MG-2023]
METGHFPLWQLGIALLLGAVIGLQRGWVTRNRKEGERVAGIRTFSLVGLLGGLTGVLADIYSELIFGFALVSLSVVITVAYLTSQQRTHDVGITSLIGLLLTFVLGCLAVSGQPVIAVAAAVVTAIILDMKEELHAAMTKVQEYELEAALRLLLISAVLLPLLPDKGFGPWEAVNPFELWLLVVLIATISFIGHVAIRIGGARNGILFTSLFAGLSASTALTLQFSNLSKQEEALSPLLGSGILISCGTMFPRIIFLASVLNPSLAVLIAIPMLVMMACFYLPAIWLWLRNPLEDYESPQVKRNPLGLASALMFGFILLIIMLLSHALQTWFGDTGTYVLSALSGLTDVDAITLALGHQSQVQMSLQTAGFGIVIAACVNSLVKMLMAWGIGSRTLGMCVVPPVVIALLAAGGWFWLQWC